MERVYQTMIKCGVDCLIIKDETTVRYLTGFTGDSSLFYLDANQGVLITDGRYVEQAKAEIKPFQVLHYTGNIWDAAAGLVGKLQCVGFDGAHYTYADYRKLQEALGVKDLRTVSLDDIRMVKDKQELDRMLAAAQIADEAFSRLLPEIRPGRTERELAAELEYYMRALGSEKVSFDTIVASGFRSALPHGAASDKSVASGDFVTFDFGAVCDGYHSDMTRTLVVGKAAPWQKEIYNAVLAAHVAGKAAGRPGITGRELDAVARKVLHEWGYAEYFIHGLGHGVGLEIHEMPNINKGGTVPLESGMVFTIEPGIYIPARGGVRIEDTVVLTDAGVRPLNTSELQLIEIM